MDSNTDDCSICYSPLSNNLTINLPCNHIFHNNCFEKWIDFQVEHSYPKTCPCCRYDLKQTNSRLPTQLFDELIGKDGDINSLNEHNYNYFYYLLPDAYTKEQKLENIRKIKEAKNFKNELRLFHKYTIIGFNKTFSGMLIQINQIDNSGCFSCHIMTANGLQFYHYPINNIEFVE